MNLNDHMIECLGKLGNPFKEVHIWLDEYFHDPKYKARHRKKRHHLAGIEEVRKKWGDEAAEAAYIHIVSDLKMEGWNPEKDRMPLNEMDYIKMGLF
ncbi:MAG: hypothetical protein A2Y41_04790 [Spirochaetes bacterium GWB1_36_13]|nr:MAG: hypothetical protein A2Y41_04790 [Spirochaetes bacterium GWB1_36_13]